MSLGGALPYIGHLGHFSNVHCPNGGIYIVDSKKLAGMGMRRTRRIPQSWLLLGIAMVHSMFKNFIEAWSALIRCTEGCNAEKMITANGEHKV